MNKIKNFLLCYDLSQFESDGQYVPILLLYNNTYKSYYMYIIYTITKLIICNLNNLKYFYMLSEKIYIKIFIKQPHIKKN